MYNKLYINKRKNNEVVAIKNLNDEFIKLLLTCFSKIFILIIMIFKKIIIKLLNQ